MKVNSTISERQATKDDFTFLVLGGQRCGSTWLYEALKEHPEIYVPASKQTHFFDESYHNGMDWYLKHFQGIQRSHKAVGEVATGYCLPASISNVHAQFPGIKLIMVMRNPVERANSYYRSRAPHENWKSLSEALENDQSIIERGQYCDQLEVLLKLYKREQLLLLVYDDLQQDEAAYVSRVYDFLGVDPKFKPAVIGSSVRAAMFPGTRRLLKRMGLTYIVNAVNHSFLGDLLRRLVRTKRSSKKKTQSMPAEIRAELIKHYRPYNKRLEKILGRDLSSWND